VAAVILKAFTQRLASLGMLLVRLEIIATTYRSTIFKTYAFSLYFPLCIYRDSYLSTHGISGLAARGDCQQFKLRLKMTIE